MDTVAPFLILLGIALLFWIAMIRPQQKRQRALGQLQRELAVGDEVMLTSGIIGVVRSLDDTTVHIEVSEGMTLRVVRGAVGQVTTPSATGAGFSATSDPVTGPVPAADETDGTELAARPADEPEEK